MKSVLFEINKKEKKMLKLTERYFRDTIYESVTVVQVTS